MGLAFQSIAVDHVPPYFYDLIAAGVLDSNIFTFWLQELSGQPQGSTGGQITLGAMDSAHCNNNALEWVSLTSATYFQINIQGYQAGSTSKTRTQSAIIDSGTSFLAGPNGDIRRIAEACGGKYDAIQGIYSIGCSTAPSCSGGVVFKINGNSYAINTNNIKVQFGSQCFLAMQGFEGFGGPQWILGDTFIRSWCTVFDIPNKRVGLAPATM